MKRYILIAITIFIILNILNILRMYIEFSTYNTVHISSHKDELNTIINDTHKMSDSIFDTVINTPRVINIFKNAVISNEEDQSIIRERLYKELIGNYEIFKRYGIQQLHFHLPNNDSFLRFHKPKRFGDNLTKIRESVKYVNENKKAISGFEEGKIFNGYRFVYPLFNSNQEHIGSVEISSSLLNFKNIYEQHDNNHIDFLLSKSYVEEKLFSSELKNYKSYYSLKNYLIQSTIEEHNKEHCPHQSNIAAFLNDKNIQKKIQIIEEHIFSKIINNKIYTMNFLPLYNDFTKKKIGYKVLFTQSDYFVYFYMSIIGSLLSIPIFSFLIGYMLYINRKSLNYKKERQKSDFKTKRLLASNQLIKSVINGTSDLIFYKNKDFKYIGCNKAFSDLIGKSNDEIIGKNDFDLFDEKIATLLRNTDNIMLKKNEIISNYEWRQSINGVDIYLNTQLIPFNYDENSELIGILGISRDMTELYKTQQELRKQTFTDELTKIDNRKAYNNKLDELLFKYKRYSNQFSIVMFDIDNFKSINDTYGHQVGDDVLIELCKLVTLKIRKNDYFFRIGGEEFIILLSETTNQGAVPFSEGIRTTIEKNLNIIKDKTITVSLGVTCIQENDTADSIFKRVDDYLYNSKENGRNMSTSDINQ